MTPWTDRAVQGLDHFPGGFGAAFAPGDDLGQHGVVVHGDVRAGDDASIDANAFGGWWRGEVQEATDRR